MRCQFISLAAAILVASWPGLVRADDDGDDAITNSIGQKLIRVAPGEFSMGSDETTAELVKVFGRLREEQDADDEQPQHLVRITKPYYLGKFEVSLGEFRQFVNDSDYRTDAETDGKGGVGWVPQLRSDLFRKDFTWRYWGVNQSEASPVVNISWNDAVAFCQWLSTKEGKKYRLPTEAEWECACRAGTSTRFYTTDDPADIYRLANLGDITSYEFHGPSRIMHMDGRVTGERAPIHKGRDGFGFTAPAGRFRPNALGFFDMLGNAWEWCSDWYAADYYKNSPANDPAGPEAGTKRVLRGGGWSADPFDCRCARRRMGSPSSRNCLVGFRIARDE